MSTIIATYTIKFDGVTMDVKTYLYKGDSNQWNPSELEAQEIYVGEQDIKELLSDNVITCIEHEIRDKFNL
jgi:hypothetical protein